MSTKDLQEALARAHETDPHAYNMMTQLLEAEIEYRERRRLFMHTMRQPEMRMLVKALRHLKWAGPLDWREVGSIEVSPHHLSGHWGAEINQFYVYHNIDGVDLSRLFYTDLSYVDLHWDDLPGCLCYACEKDRSEIAA